MLGEACSPTASEHLRECAVCREFHDQQTRLRQIVGSLGTVSAPPDFDFRLRARLANESNGFASAYWPMARKGFAFAAMLLVFVVGGLLVRNALNQPATSDVVANDVQPPVPQPANQAEVPAVNDAAKQLVAETQNPPRITVKNERLPQIRPKRQLVAVDSALQRAEVLNGREPAGEFDAFPLDASLQSFKVSLDDGHGNARTISVPTVSFGSQRMMQTANQYAPKRVW